RFVHGDGHQRGDGVAAVKGLLPGRHAIKDDAETEEIAAGIDGGAAALLGGHVGGGADDRALLRQAGILRGGAGEAEVENLDTSGEGRGARGEGTRIRPSSLASRL